MPPKKAALKATSSTTIDKPRRMYLGADPLRNSAVRKGRSLANQVNPSLGFPPPEKRELLSIRSLSAGLKDLYPRVSTPALTAPAARADPDAPADAGGWSRLGWSRFRGCWRRTGWQIHIEARCRLRHASA